MGTSPPLTRYFQPGILCEGINRVSFMDYNNATQTATEGFSIGEALGQVTIIDLPLERHPIPLTPFIYGGSVNLARPLIRRCVGGTAQPGPDRTFIYELDAGPPVAGIGEAFDDHSFLLPAYWEPPGQGLYLLPGNFPALSGTVSIDPVDSQSLWVGQQVMDAPQVLPPFAMTEVLQTFGVPVTMTGTGIEVGVDDVLFPSNGVIRVYDLPSSFNPGTDGLPPIFTALPLALPLDPGVLPSFVPTVAPAPGSLVFRPGNLYGIQLSTNGTIGMRVTPTDNYLGGGAWFRAPGSPGVTFTALPGDMGFRIVGVPERLVPDPPSATGTAIALDLPGNAFAVALDLPPQPLAFAQHCPLDGATGFAIPYFPNRPAGDPLAPKFVQVELSADDINQSLGTYPLDVISIDPDRLSFGAAEWHVFTPERPIVVQALAPEPWNSVTTTAIVVRSSEPAFHMLPLFDANASGTLPAASMGIPGVMQPLPGVHPGIPVRIYTDANQANPEVVVEQQWQIDGIQNVTGTSEVVQTFRVPAACTVDWIELGIPGGGDPTRAALQLSIVDVQTGLPVNSWPPAPNLEIFPNPQLWVSNAWRSSDHYAPRSVPLDPDHEYGILLRATDPWSVATATVSGFPVPALRARPRGIAPPDAYPNGALYSRDGPAGPWQTLPGDLAFRLIGRAAGTTGVPQPPATLHSLVIEAAPNPFHGTLGVRWSGGSGAAEIHITDIAGRVVRRVHPGETANQWSWDGTDGSGRRMSPGIYFIRLARGRAAPAIRRVVLLH